MTGRNAMRQLLNLLMTLGITLGMLACDYAKPTDIDKLEEDVAGLEARIDSLPGNTSEEIATLEAKIDSLSRSGQKNDGMVLIKAAT